VIAAQRTPEIAETETAGRDIKQAGRNIGQEADPGDTGASAARFHRTRELITI
jgi:hypothetical protein